MPSPRTRIPEQLAGNCWTCGYDLSGLPRDRFGRLLCPECGSLNRPGGGDAALDRPPQHFCRECGLDVGAISGLKNMVVCPNCRHHVDLLAPGLEPRPSDAEAARVLLRFLPYSFGMFAAATGFIFAMFRGISAGMVVILLVVSASVAVMETTWEARRLAQRWPRREQDAAFAHLARIGVVRTTMWWGPVMIVVAGLAFLVL